MRGFNRDLREQEIKLTRYCQDNGFEMATLEDDFRGVDFYDLEGRACDAKFITPGYNFAIPIEFYSFYSRDRQVLGWLFDPKMKTEVYHFVMPCTSTGREIDPPRPERVIVITKDELLQAAAIGLQRPYVYTHMVRSLKRAGSSRTAYIYEDTLVELLRVIRGEGQLDEDKLEDLFMEGLKWVWTSPQVNFFSRKKMTRHRLFSAHFGRLLAGY